MIEYQDKYIADALQLISNVEEVLLKLEENPMWNEGIQEIFRVLHTLKGSAGMFGLNQIESFTHILENKYHLIREGTEQLSPLVIQCTFEAMDLIVLMLESKENLSESKKQRVLHIQQAIAGLETQYVTESEIFQTDISHNQYSTPSQASIWLIRFIPDSDLFMRGVNPMGVFREIAELASIQTRVNFQDVPSLDRFKYNTTHLSWDLIITGSDISREAIEDVFMFYLDNEYIALSLNAKDHLSDLELEAINDSFKDFLFHPDEIQAECMKLESRLAAAMKENTLKTYNPEEPGNIEVQTKKNSVINVASERLDDYVNLVSELVILNSQMELQVQKYANPEMSKLVSSLNKLSRKFRDNALHMRLVQIDVLLVRLRRLIRDVSLKLGKEVEFVSEGTDTELDKTIINALEAPLLHILRNSLDHGIETPEERLRKNKSRQGIIRFISFYSGANVFIQIQDDGKGIDPEFIRTKAIEKGLINAKDTPDKKECLALIFAPGFTTAETVSEISGRGVGMDVVRQTISDLRGEIDVDSEINLGTSVTLKLPLTLSIIDTLMVRIENSIFLIPLSSIISCHNISALQPDTYRRQIVYDSELIPTIDLAEEFCMDAGLATKQKVVIISHFDKYYGLIVDEVIGENQAVIRPLSYFHRHQEFLSGASILGDGRLALILDTTKLIKRKILK